MARLKIAVFRKAKFLIFKDKSPISFLLLSYNKYMTKKIGVSLPQERIFSLPMFPRAVPQTTR